MTVNHKQVRENIYRILTQTKAQRIPVAAMQQHLADMGCHDVTSREIRARVGELILLDKKPVGVDEGGYFIVNSMHLCRLAKQYRMKPAMTTIKLAEMVECNYIAELEAKAEQQQLSLPL